MSYPPPISVLKECNLFKWCKKLHPASDVDVCRTKEVKATGAGAASITDTFGLRLFKQFDRNTKKPPTSARSLKEDGGTTSITVDNLVGQALPDKNDRGKAAFTLAEVLITLVVLGIVAAITVPTLRNSLDDKKYKIPLKKTYAVLSEALDNTFHYSDFDNSTLADEGSILPKMKHLFSILAPIKVCCPAGKKLGIDDECYWGSDTLSNACFVRPKHLDGTLLNGDFSPSSKTYRSSFILKDETGVTFKTQHKAPLAGMGIDANYRTGFGSATNPQYLEIFVDVNGTRDPNVMGKDIHLFVYTRSSGLVPAGADANSSNTLVGDCNETNRWGCTYSYMSVD